MLTSLWKDFWAVMGQLCCPQPSGSPAFIWQGSAEAFAQPRAPSPCSKGLRFTQHNTLGRMPFGGVG